MKPENQVLAQYPTARVRWRQGELPMCQIIDWYGHQLGCVPRDLALPLPEIIAAAWQDAAAKLKA